MKLLNVDMSMYAETVYYPKLDPLIIIDNNGIYPELRENLITCMEQSSNSPSGVFEGLSGQIINSSYRSSSHCFVNQEMYDAVKSRLDYATQWQMSQQPNQRQYLLAENLQFLRYSSAENGHFKAHTDNGYIDTGGVFQYTSPHRVLASISYLNDNFEGGEISFPNIVLPDGHILVIKPKPSMTVLFPADMRYPHEVHPVTSGIRYCVVAWYNVAI